MIRLPKFDVDNKRVVYPGARATGRTWDVKAHFGGGFVNASPKPIWYGSPVTLAHSSDDKAFAANNPDLICVSPIVGADNNSRVMGIAIPSELGSMGSELDVINNNQQLDDLDGYLKRWSVPAYDPVANPNQQPARLDVLIRGDVYSIVSGLTAEDLTANKSQLLGVPVVFSVALHPTEIQEMLTATGDPRIQTGDWILSNSQFLGSQNSKNAQKLPFQVGGADVYLIPMNFSLGTEFHS